MITSNRCSFQSVGETVQKLNKSFNWHRTGFNQPGNYGLYRILSHHFHKGACCNASYSIQTLENLEGNGRTARKALDASMTPRPKQREKTWMLKLRTVYLENLDDRLGDEYQKKDCSCSCG